MSSYHSDFQWIYVIQLSAVGRLLLPCGTKPVLLPYTDMYEICLLLLASIRYASQLNIECHYHQINVQIS